MAVESRAEATWQGDLMSGSGSVRPASGSFGELPLTWKKRAEEREGGTSPEELIAAAEAGCFSMALSHGLAQAGHRAESLRTSVTVGFQPGHGITGIQVSVRGRVPGLDEAGFKEAAETAGHNCPVSKALAGATITVDAALEQAEPAGTAWRCARFLTGMNALRVLRNLVSPEPAVPHSDLEHAHWDREARAWVTHAAAEAAPEEPAA